MCIGHREARIYRVDVRVAQTVQAHPQLLLLQLHGRLMDRPRVSNGHYCGLSAFVSEILPGFVADRGNLEVE